MKSHVSDTLKVAKAVFLDAFAQCAAKVSSRDWKTIQSRVEYQGMSFLTITLPNFCADFERSLARGMVDPAAFQYFRKAGSIPAFLQGLIGQVFDKETGSKIHETPTENEVRIVSSVRQICLTFKKIELPCTSKRNYKAVEKFVEVERSFNVFPLPEADSLLFESVSRVLWDNSISRITESELVPRHGPGATAERISGNQKYVWRRWHERLERFFPLVGNGYPLTEGIPELQKELEKLSFVPSEAEQPARVCLVPKTLKGPRVIAIEPCCMQYAQQAVSRSLVRAIKRNRFTKGHVNFDDQSINQRLALTSSVDGRYATIDLSDASDRVPIGYALYMFRSNPFLKDLIEACRSTRAEVPDGRVISLRKFASMGSALCFPIEAMYFYTICVVALLVEKGLPVSHENVYCCSRDVYVYGDDIIVPTEHAAAILEHLDKYNCRVNARKTFLSGFFRESCGTDAYYGTRVTPVYVNTLPAENRRQADRLASRVASANQFFKAGYVRTAHALLERVEKILGILPWVHSESGLLGREFPSPFVAPRRVNDRYQCLEERHWVLGEVRRADVLSSLGALMKCLLRLESLPALDAERDHHHLSSTALHGEVTLKRRWTQAVPAWRIL